MKASRPRVLVLGALGIALGSAIAVLACERAPQGSSASARAGPVARVLIVGVDGLDWNVLRPLLAEGRCPNLRSLMDRGSWGRLATQEPTKSPILWTTIATGRLPAAHGILNFATLEEQELRPYTSSQRRVRALWNVADRHGLESMVLGWWITWPVEPIRGVMVSGSSSPALLADNAKPALLMDAPHQVHPESLTGEVMGIAAAEGSNNTVQRLAREKIFLDIPEGSLGRVEQDLIQQTLWSIQSDATFGAIAAKRIAEHPADLTMVYFGTPDVAGHRFWRYYDPGPFRWPADPEIAAKWEARNPDRGPLIENLATREGEQALARVIPNVYAWFDELLGKVLAAAGEQTTVIVLSDHGMHADSTDAVHALFLTGNHQDAPPGVLVAAGPGIVRQGDVAAFLAGEAPPMRGSVLSVAPTVLALLGIPSSREIERQAEVGLLEGRARENASLPLVPTLDDGFRAARSDPPPPQMQENYIERYRALGYIGVEEDEEPEPEKRE